MKSIIKYSAIIFAVILMAGSVYAGEAASKAGKAGCLSSDAIGKAIVNPQREHLGDIKDFVFDQGRVSFVILSYGGVVGFGGKSVAIPYSALSFDTKDRLFVLDATKDRLEAAPAFDRKMLSDRSWAADMYRYFGQQPYWTEEGGKSPAIDQPQTEEKSEWRPTGFDWYYPWY
jgi:hypothetical protein